MAETHQIVAQKRTTTGKTSHRLAGQNLIPAVIYGAGREAQSIALDRHEFELFLQHHEGTAGLVELKVEGESAPVKAMLKQVQTSPIKGNVLHVDFFAVRMDQKVQSPVGLHFVGDAAGVKSGGVFLHELREVTVEALPASLPEFLEIDITDLEMGDSIRVSDIPVPDGVQIIDDPEGIVGSITAPTAEPSEEELAAEAEEVEPEVIGESSEE
ncbi:MAG: 50S ribosomal protein L25 [Coriobacteriia bacterium]